MSVKEGIARYIITCDKAKESTLYKSLAILAGLIALYFFFYPDLDFTLKSTFITLGMDISPIIVDVLSASLPLIAVGFAYIVVGKYPDNYLRASSIVYNAAINMVFITILVLGLSMIDMSNLSINYLSLYRIIPAGIIVGVATLLLFHYLHFYPFIFSMSIISKGTPIPIDLSKIVPNKEQINLEADEKLRIEIIGAKHYINAIDVILRGQIVLADKEVQTFRKKIDIEAGGKGILKIVYKHLNNVKELFELQVASSAIIEKAEVKIPAIDLSKAKLLRINFVKSPKTRRVIEVKYFGDKPISDVIINIVSEELGRKIELSELDIRYSNNKPIESPEKYYPEEDMTIFVYLKKAKVKPKVVVEKRSQKTMGQPLLRETRPTKSLDRMYSKIEELLDAYSKMREDLW